MAPASEIDQVLAGVSRRTILLVSIASVVVLTALTALLATVRDETLADLFAARQSPAAQLALGAMLGLAVAAAVTPALVHIRALAPFRRIARSALDAVRPTRADMLLVSLNAGFAEELFFRGGLQPLIGLVPAALVFAFLHTGLPRRPHALFFALYVFVLGLGLGALFAHSGLVAAMTAHAVFDFVFLVWAELSLRRAEPNANAAPPPQ